LARTDLISEIEAMTTFNTIQNPPPALKRFLDARAKHKSSIEHLNKLADAAMLEQEEAAEREAERVKAKRPRLVSNGG
jgi:hypothetical protein